MCLLCEKKLFKKLKSLESIELDIESTFHLNLGALFAKSLEIILSTLQKTQKAQS